MTASGPRWTGEVRLIAEHLEDPLRWKRPRKIFVNSMSDLFHESLSDEVIDKVFAVMALSPQHTFQVLTKRAERMHDYLTGKNYKARHYQVESLRADGDEARRSDIRCEIVSIGGHEGYNRIEGLRWPLPNVWPGVSVENQETADERIPWLLKTPVAVRWISYEPALGPVDFRPYMPSHPEERERRVNGAAKILGISKKSARDFIGSAVYPEIKWVVCGGESGPDARPMHPAWARSVRDQCVAAGAPFHFKQWGAWAPSTFDGRIERDFKIGRFCILGTNGIAKRTMEEGMP